MQLAELRVSGLFDALSHKIVFPNAEEDNPRASVTILHGPNGIGKTTILRMLDGLMKLDFNPFRQVPFAECALKFNNGDTISVWREMSEDVLRAVLVKFKNHEIRLHPRRPGALEEAEQPVVEKFRLAFKAATESLTFEFIDTARMLGILRLRDDDVDVLHTASGDVRVVHSSPAAVGKVHEGARDLALRVQRFVREAQGNYRRFFTSSQPELFPRILERLTGESQVTPTTDELLERLQKVQQFDREAKRLGLEAEPVDYKQLTAFLEKQRNEPGLERALTVLTTYVEALEARVAERQLVAERLRIFERLMNEFFENKRIRITARKGFEITTTKGKFLREDQLSSGEYHLLYLMVTALVTQRHGSVIAIDEPEMSMHLKWQRNLIRALIECASRAEPQFIFATHSPEIAADYIDDMISLTAAPADIPALTE
jgi:ABC-type enterochelin transport system ATPase subunit